MIERHLSQLYGELKLGNVPPFEGDGTVQLRLASLSFQVIKLDSGTYLSATIGPMPTKDKEEFLLKLMKANFLGQGTGGGVLGLKEDESFLTLSLSLPYEMDYKTFKENVEEFINYLEYWKNETIRHETEAQVK